MSEKKKKYLTIDDLYKFFEKQDKDCRFSVKDDNKQYLIKVEADMTFDADSQNDLLAVHLQACHTGENVNKCFISEDSMNAALPTLINKPILGYIYKDNEGEFQFRDHAMHKENGEIVYDEEIIGFLPESCNPHIKYDEEKKKNFVEVDGYIVEKYTKAADILRREEKCQVSVEMAVNEMSYDAHTRILNITDFIFTGVTILGRFEDGTEVQAGMAGSNITIRDSEISFAEQQAKLEELARQVAEIQNSLSINNSEKGGTESPMKIDELLAKYNKTAEDVTFDTEGLSDEELEAKFEEVFGEAVENETTVEETTATQSEEGEEVGAPESEESDNGENVDNENVEGEVSQVEADIVASIKTKSSDKISTFGLSLTEKENAIHELVNLTYGDADNDYYFTDTYEDDGYVIMRSWCTNRAYRQNIERVDDQYSLVGDRVEVFAVYVTQEEKDSLESMRNSYADILSKLQNYEDESSKMDVLNKEEYDSVRDTEEFADLLKTETHFEMSVDEVTEKADSILLNAAKNKTLNFASKDVQATRKPLPFKKAKGTGRYGNMFSHND
jgi:hypothetical protein